MIKDLSSSPNFLFSILPSEFIIYFPSLPSNSVINLPRKIYQHRLHGDGHANLETNPESTSN